MITFFRTKYQTGVFGENSEFACQLELAVWLVLAVTMAKELNSRSKSKAFNESFICQRTEVHETIKLFMPVHSF